MASYTFSLDHICSGGEHVRMIVSRDGGANGTFDLMGSDIMTNLSNEEAVLALLRIRMRGKTRNQARTDLQAGFTVTI